MRRRTVLRHARTVTRLSRDDRALLAYALLRLWDARLALWRTPFARVYHRFTDPSRPTPSSARHYSATARSAEQIVRLVRGASRLVPRATCLVRALVTYQLLRWHGYTPTIRIGVTRDVTRDVRKDLEPRHTTTPPPIAAHAWVECDGRVVMGGDARDFVAYTPLPILETRLS